MARNEAVGGTPVTSAPKKADTLWPKIIFAGLFLVIAVNAAFLYVAVRGQDGVVPSYLEGERWGDPQP